MSQEIVIQDLPQVTFTKFYGGEERGLCLQITPSVFARQAGFIQLSSRQVQELIEQLSKYWKAEL